MGPTKSGRWPVETPLCLMAARLCFWNGGGYDILLSDSGATGLWDDGGGNPMDGSPVVPVGKGFFLSPFTPCTNVFAGTVAVMVGTSNVMSLPVGGANYLVGCAVPYAGAITNGNNSGGGPYMFSNGGIPDAAPLMTWDGGGYNTYYSDSGADGGWDDGGGNPLEVPPSITVGQGFFLSPFTPCTWTVGL